MLGPWNYQRPSGLMQSATKKKEYQDKGEFFFDVRNAKLATTLSNRPTPRVFLLV